MTKTLLEVYKRKSSDIIIFYFVSHGVMK